MIVDGTLFDLSPSGTYGSLALLASTNGWFPDGEMIEGPDGSLYGTTSTGGGNGGGDVYQLFQLVKVPPTFLSTSQNAGTATFTWNAITGRNYEVQYRNDLLQGSWMNLTGIIPATNATMVTTMTISPGANYFYRVQTE